MQQKITALILLGLVLLACSFINPLLPTTPTVVPTFPPDNPVATPALSQAQIGVYRIQYVRYDPSLWQAEPSLDSGGQPIRAAHGQEIQVLKHLQYDCELHENLGHGMGEQFRLETYEYWIGELQYRVERWDEASTAHPVLVVYQFPAQGDPNTARRIEMTSEDEFGAMCMGAVEQILKQSADLVQ